MGFINHPSPDESEFLAQTKVATLELARAAVIDVAESFTAIGTYRQVRQIHPQVYDFSHWLTRNRSQMDLDRVTERLNGLTG